LLTNGLHLPSAALFLAGEYPLFIKSYDYFLQTVGLCEIVVGLAENGKIRLYNDLMDENSLRARILISTRAREKRICHVIEKNMKQHRKKSYFSPKYSFVFDAI
jgi:hypothetical protein